RFPVELRVQAAKLATVIESVDLIDMPGGARRRCPAIEQRRVSKIPALLRPNARQPIEPRGQTERARQWHGATRVEIQLPHPAVLVEAIGIVAVGADRELRPQEAAYVVGPRAGVGEQRPPLPVVQRLLEAHRQMHPMLDDTGIGGIEVAIERGGSRQRAPLAKHGTRRQLRLRQVLEVHCGVAAQERSGGAVQPVCTVKPLIAAPQGTPSTTSRKASNSCSPHNDGTLPAGPVSPPGGASAPATVASAARRSAPPRRRRSSPRMTVSGAGT